jgi:uncharacterized protein (TIGR03435 family)
MNRLRSVLFFAAISALGQAPVALPEFEVASVKPSDPESTSAIRRSGYRLNTTNTSLQKLVTWAYDIPDDRLFGKPKWLDSVRYDIAAEAPQGPLERGQLQRMMQSLLAARFQLAIHREARELPMYMMVAGKNGPKVHPVETREGIGQNPFSMTGRGRLTGTKVTAGMLAKVLSDQLGRAVQDGTGLTGVFDFTLEWAPDSDPAGPSLFTALQEQLGFKLEARKGPVEVIVIDHMESTPTGN